jgi:thymidylate synthase (FAD)
LNWGFAVLHFGGFPHDTVMQMVRHQDPDELVQSNRYTGKRYITLAKIPEAEAMTHVEDLFYVKPAGRYSTRSGSYTVTEAQRNETLRECWQSCEQYRVAVEEWGWPEEDARRKLNGAFRQNFTMSGTLADHFHWLDQRTLDDTQIECQTLAYMALGKLEAWSPGLFGWYRANRAGKNLLAP